MCFSIAIRKSLSHQVTCAGLAMRVFWWNFCIEKEAFNELESHIRISSSFLNKLKFCRLMHARIDKLLRLIWNRVLWGGEAREKNKFIHKLFLYTFFVKSSNKTKKNNTKYLQQIHFSFSFHCIALRTKIQKLYNKKCVFLTNKKKITLFVNFTVCN